LRLKGLTNGDQEKIDEIQWCDIEHYMTILIGAQYWVRDAGFAQKTFQQSIEEALR
jgi:hypothetical protein